MVSIKSLSKSGRGGKTIKFTAESHTYVLTSHHIARGMCVTYVSQDGKPEVRIDSITNAAIRRLVSDALIAADKMA